MEKQLKSAMNYLTGIAVMDYILIILGVIVGVENKSIGIGLFTLAPILALFSICKLKKLVIEKNDIKYAKDLSKSMVFSYLFAIVGGFLLRHTGSKLNIDNITSLVLTLDIGYAFLSSVIYLAKNSNKKAEKN